MADKPERKTTERSAPERSFGTAREKKGADVEREDDSAVTGEPFVVNPGHTVQQEGEMKGPGSTVKVSAKEGAKLMNRGVVRRPGDPVPGAN